MATTRTFDSEQYASKLDEIGNKLPNLVGDHLALIAYGAELKGLAQRVRNPEEVRPNPAGQPDIRPDFKTLHGDGQDDATRPKVRLESDENAPQHLPIAKPNSPAGYADLNALDERDAKRGAEMAEVSGVTDLHRGATTEPYPYDGEGNKIEPTNEKPDTEQSVTDKTKYGTGSDTQKGAGKPGKL